MGIYYVSGVPYSSDYLMHFGIKGQKWGIRRYQNPDGTLTDAGKKHYYGDKNANDYDDYYLSMKQREHFNNVTEKEFNSAYKRTAKEDKKRYALEGRPNEIQAAHETAARKIIANRKTVKEKREELYRALKPELQFETNHKLWKKYGYDPDDKSFSTIHDVWDSYYDAKEKYMSDKGLGKGSDARKEYEKNRTSAFETYNYYIDNAITDMLGYYGNTPVSVTTKWGNKYYAVARNSIAKSLKYGSYADPGLFRSDGVLDFYSLSDDYERDKKNSK